ncbi:MAG: competence/damage-inducible protein A [Chlorobium phaeobacteroides]|jgi:nicotinamide-nucleotide amidase|nr:competence/damage-inducible protein A [Chlorobium phaeobacteroides]
MVIRSEIVSIGDELLKGQRVNTNASFIASALSDIGIPVVRVVACGDAEEEIMSALRESLERADIVLVTGGLGPTRDDRTLKAAAGLLQRDLKLSPAAFDALQEWFVSRGRKMPEAMRDQARIIEGSLLVPNTTGTAAGMIADAGERFMNHTLVLMPGVPSEMKAMMNQTVIPYFAASSKMVIRHTPVRTLGIGETLLAELVVEVEDHMPEGTTLAYLPHTAGVDLMVSTIGSSVEAVERDNRGVVDALLARTGRYVYATEDVTIEETVGRLLAQRGMTIAVAESCTGGLLASRLTDIAGSSRYFLEGVVVYSNKAKEHFLGVKFETLQLYGAVSPEVAAEMAEGCLFVSGADIAVSTTGIAGPSNESEDKPVGMLCLGVARKEPGGEVSVSTRTLFYHGTREQNKLRFSQAALCEVWESLQDR